MDMEASRRAMATTLCVSGWLEQADAKGEVLGKVRHDVVCRAFFSKSFRTDGFPRTREEESLSCGGPADGGLRSSNGERMGLGRGGEDVKCA